MELTLQKLNIQCNVTVTACAAGVAYLTQIGGGHKSLYVYGPDKLLKSWLTNQLTIRVTNRQFSTIKHLQKTKHG